MILCNVNIWKGYKDSDYYFAKNTLNEYSLSLSQIIISIFLPDIYLCKIIIALKLINIVP